MSLFEANNLSCERDDRVLFENLSFAFSAGELVQVKGPNGAGKSTLLRILAGIFNGYEGELTSRPEAGSIRYFGHKIPVKLNLTAMENLLFYASVLAPIAPEQCAEALKRLGMNGYEDALCSDMSEGQRRRVALASVLLSDTPVCLLDEPFSSLDVHGVSFLESYLVEQSKKGRLVVFTSHHKFEAPELRLLDLGEHHV